jgi:hypothetical protein
MCSIFFCIIAVVETVCLAVGLSIIRYLRKNKHCFSAQTYSMQLQLISLLVIQVSVWNVGYKFEIQANSNFS